MVFGIARAGWLAPVLLAGCAANSGYDGPRTERTALLSVRAEGIYAHPAYPDDVVWAKLYRRGSQHALGTKKLTVEMPIAKFEIDEGVAYVVEFISTEAQFGGYSNCVARTELSPVHGGRYAIFYRTAKSSCLIESSLLDAQTGRYTRATTSTGVVSGPQYGSTAR